MTSVLTSPTRSLKRVTQRASHANLSLDVSRLPAPSTRTSGGHLDAIIVPASRPASSLQPAIDLAASLDVLLVILCSKQTRVEQVAQRVAGTPRARCLIVPVHEAWTHKSFPSRTSDQSFDEAKAGRASDLSKKRNLGLLLARLNGWNKITFVDDDITLSRTENLARLAGQLDRHHIAGMVLQEFPDNSVVCHARRLSGATQDVFVSGAVLGVHTNSLPLSFFPDIYNEDWFFFAKDAARRSLPGVGNAVQKEYDPYASPTRARWEEFGDLLAEGLFALFGGSDPSAPFTKLLSKATRAYWDRFIEARRTVLAETSASLQRLADRGSGEHVVYAALESLSAAGTQLNDAITTDLCLQFLDAWQQDLHDWQTVSSRINNVGSIREAMDFLGLRTWRLAEFGGAEVDHLRGSHRLTRLVSA